MKAEDGTSLTKKEKNNLAFYQLRLRGVILEEIKTGKEKKLGIKMLIFLQMAVCIYTLSGIAAKLASRYELSAFFTFLRELFSSGFDKSLFTMENWGFVICYGCELLVLGIYAIIWQQIIKRIDISTAYANRALAIFWSTLWAVLFFKETISIQNIIGIVIIVVGTWMVNRDG